MSTNNNDNTSNRAPSKERLEEVRTFITELDARLEAHNENRKKVQRSLHSQCEEMRKQIDELEEHVNNNLETQFTEEDARIQEAKVALQRAVRQGAKEEELDNIIQHTKAELLVKQSYTLKRGLPKEEGGEGDGVVPILSKAAKLSTEKEVVAEVLNSVKPPAPKVNKVSTTDVVTLTFSFFNEEEKKVIAKK